MFGDPTYDQLVDWCTDLREMLDDAIEWFDGNQEDKEKFLNHVHYGYRRSDLLDPINEFLDQPAWMNPTLVEA